MPTDGEDVFEVICLEWMLVLDWPAEGSVDLKL